MKEYRYTYEKDDGSLGVPITGEILIFFILFFWTLPFIGLAVYFLQFFKSNMKIVTQEDYYRHNLKYHIKKSKESTK